MIEPEIPTDELRVTLSREQADEALRALLPQASARVGRLFTLFDLAEGDRGWAVVTVIQDTPVLVEARYLAGLDDPRCARLQADLFRLFGAASAAPQEPPAPLSFRELLHQRLLDNRESGVRVRRLSFGPPASPELIARIERDHLGFPMPDALRDFFAAHDGLTLLFHRTDDPADEIFDRGLPLQVESEAPIRWYEAAEDGGALWELIRQADFGHSDRGGFYFAGLICVPSLSEIFDTDWCSILGWPRGLYLFDAWHPFFLSALRVDPQTQTVCVQPTEDHGADRSAAPVDLVDYLEQIGRTCGADRQINGRSRAVYSVG